MPTVAGAVAALAAGKARRDVDDLKVWSDVGWVGRRGRGEVGIRYDAAVLAGRTGEAQNAGGRDVGR